VKDKFGGRKEKQTREIRQGVNTYVPGGTSPIKFSAAMIPDACPV
jgi:hypothetical protein